MSGIVNVKLLVATGLAIVVIGAVSFWWIGQRPLGETQPVEYRHKTVQTRLKVWSTVNRPISDVRLYAYAPIKENAHQRCLRIDASHPYALSTDDQGNQLLTFNFSTFPPYGVKIISIRADLSVAPIAVSHPNRSPDPITPALADKRYKDLHQLAHRLAADTPLAGATNIYDWVADNIAYTGYSRQAKGPLVAFQRRQGDCTEFADLFVALAQALDIPARRVSGYLTRENSVLKPADVHDWAEFYDNGTWRIADPQQRVFDHSYPDYIAIRINSPTAPGGGHRFHVDAEGIKVKMDS